MRDQPDSDSNNHATATLKYSYSDYKDCQCILDHCGCLSSFLVHCVGRSNVLPVLYTG